MSEGDSPGCGRLGPPNDANDILRASPTQSVQAPEVFRFCTVRAHDTSTVQPPKVFSNTATCGRLTWYNLTVPKGMTVWILHYPGNVSPPRCRGFFRSVREYVKALYR